MPEKNTIQSVADFLEGFAPTCMAEEWDNVGLLVGNRMAKVDRVMTCLTVTPASAEEAVERGADLIVAHHPLPFRPLKRLTPETTTGSLLLQLIEAKIAVYSPHTAFDSAREGINQCLAEGLGLEAIAPLVPNDQGLGSGRYGCLVEPISLEQWIERIKHFLAIDRLQYVGASEKKAHRVAIACGAAGEFLETAQAVGCDTMLIGETRFHTCLEAEALKINLVLPGHFASERFAVIHLAEVLAKQFPMLEVWASRQEQDPIRWG